MNSVLIIPLHCYTILCWYTHTSHPPRVLPDSDESLSARQQVSPCSWMAESGMLSLSHVSVKTNTQQSLVSCCVDRLSLIKSSLFSRERTFESISDGIAGLVGLALSLARIPPRLPRFCPLSHRRRRRFVRVASVGEAAVSGSGFSSRQRPCSFSVVAGESWCLYTLSISRRLWRS